MDPIESKLSTLIAEERQIAVLSDELEKVLHYYQEHPQYPLDYDKIRKRVKEVSTRLHVLGEQMKALVPGQGS